MAIIGRGFKTRTENNEIQFWLNSEFSLWEQINDPVKKIEQPEIDVYIYKMPVAAYFSMTNSLRAQNESLRGYF